MANAALTRSALHRAVRALGPAGWLVLLLAAPMAAAEATMSLEPEYLRLSSARDYTMTVTLFAYWACEQSASPPPPVRLSVQPSSYQEELGPVFAIRPSLLALNWTAGDQSNGVVAYSMQETIEATVERTGQPFEDRSFRGTWWAQGIQLGRDCRVTDDERNANRADLWREFELAVPVIEDTLEPANAPAPIPFALLLALAGVAVRMRAAR